MRQRWQVEGCLTSVAAGARAGVAGAQCGVRCQGSRVRGFGRRGGGPARIGVVALLTWPFTNVWQSFVTKSQLSGVPY